MKVKDTESPGGKFLFRVEHTLQMKVKDTPLSLLQRTDWLNIPYK